MSEDAILERFDRLEKLIARMAGERLTREEMCERLRVVGKTLTDRVRRGKVPANPFANLPISTGTTERERVLSDTEIAEAWAAGVGVCIRRVRIIQQVHFGVSFIDLDPELIE